MLAAAALMARSGLSLKQAADELEVEYNSDQCYRVLRTVAFQKILFQERARWFTELGRDPSYTKDSAVGKLLALSQKLEETGEFDKSAEVILKVAKLQGWMSPDSQINVFGELSQKDLDAIREKVSKVNGAISLPSLPQRGN